MKKQDSSGNSSDWMRQSLVALKAAGLSFSQCVEVFGQTEETSRFIRAAKRISTDELEVDDNAVVSESDDGAFVQSWMWVSNADALDPANAPAVIEEFARLTENIVDTWGEDDIRKLQEFAKKLAPTDATATPDPESDLYPPMVVIKVLGGLVQGAVSNVPGVDVLVLDYDSTDDEDSRDYPEKDGSVGVAKAWFEPPLNDSRYTKTLLEIASRDDGEDDDEPASS